jgi:hypothetical protein
MKAERERRLITYALERQCSHCGRATSSSWCDDHRPQHARGISSARIVVFVLELAIVVSAGAALALWALG